MRRELTDTTTSAIRTELMLSSQQLGGLTTGVVLNLIIMADESTQYDAVSAASQAGREHPCRVLGVISRNGGRPQPRIPPPILGWQGPPGE